MAIEHFSARTCSYGHTLPTDTFLWRLRRFFAGEEAVRGLHQEVHGAEHTDARGPRERKSCRQEFSRENMEI